MRAAGTRTAVVRMQAFYFSVAHLFFVYNGRGQNASIFFFFLPIYSPSGMARVRMQAFSLFSCPFILRLKRPWSECKHFIFSVAHPFFI